MINLKAFIVLNIKGFIVLNIMKLKKPHFNCFSEEITGPYFDPNDGHIHNWKNSSLIKNFTGEQDPRYSEYSIDTNKTVKNGEYCCICHKRKSGFVTIPINNFINPASFEDNIKPTLNYGSLKHESLNYESLKHEHKTKIIDKNEPLILYRLNNHESLYIKFSEMTFYQKFRYINPEYKSKTLFIINNNKFCKNYYMLENIN